MRRLRIGWVGTSKALQAVRQLVEQYGHPGTHESTDLVIEDASLTLPAHLAQVPRISLRLGVGPLTEHGLPTLQLRCYDRCQRLMATQELPEEPSGNGQRLRQQASDTLGNGWPSMSAVSRATQGICPKSPAPTPGLNRVCWAWTPWRSCIGSIARLTRTCCKPPKCP